MKKNLFTLLILTTVLLIAACGNDNSDSEGNTDSGEKSTEWPHNNTTFILPFGAGGSLDTWMRNLSPYLEEELDTRISIDNREGAATQTGTTVFHEGPNDGSYLFAGTQLYFSATMVLQGADYNIDDFAMVNIEQFDPITITVPKDSKYETFGDLIEDIKENPGKISYSTVSGGPLHLTGVLLEDKLDIELNPVFYDGGSEMRNALLGDHVDFMIGNSNGDTAIEENVRVLATATDEVSEIWPDAEPINDALEKYDVEIPQVGSVRFIATQASFKEENPELFEELVTSYKNAYNAEDYQAHLKESGADLVSDFRGPEESDKLNRELHDLIVEYKDELTNN